MACSSPKAAQPELLLHPSDKRDRAFLLAAADDAGIIGGLFTQAQARRHLGLIRKHLLFSDGARLMDRPIAYHGGPETIFRRAESAVVLRPRNRAHVYAFASALRRGDERSRRIRRAVGGALASPIRSPSPIGSRMRRCGSATPISAAATRRSATAIRRAPNGRASGPAVSPSTADGGSIPAALASTRTCSFAMRLGCDGSSASGSRPQASESRARDLTLAWPGRPGGGSRRR